MAKKKRNIRKRDPRVLLSDVLPYELPPSFNNRGLYNFMNDVHLRIEGGDIRARHFDASTVAMLSITLGRPVSFPAGTLTGDDAALTGAGVATSATIPFQFNVRHRANDYRTLTVPHPAAQLQIVDFYKKNADLMLYYTNRSSYSLRHPASIARYSVVRDWLFEDNLRSSDSIEMHSQEYEWLRSYFTYQRYSNVYKFYDSPEYRTFERKYGYLVKADVAKCFDSIYTHSIAWATHGHRLVKENIRQLDGTFGDDFDKLMQRLNHNETSGITIGSETSRIFAEIVLQAVDRDIHKNLSQDGLVQGTDYEILRYVDDYFIFLANPQTRMGVLEQIGRSLRIYKLHLNSAKEEGENTPWLSPLTIAKERTTRLVSKALELGRFDDDPDHLTSPYVRAEQLIVGYKSILLDTSVSHLDLANFALARAERATEKLIKSSRSSIESHVDAGLEKQRSHVHAMAGALIALLDFVFFAYSGAPRMSPAVKVARVVSTVLRFSRLPYVPVHERERLELRIREEILTQLVRARRNESPSAVTACLVDCLSDMGDHYRVSETQLADIFSFDESPAGGFLPPRNMNALLLFSILLHIRDSADYPELRASCLEWAINLQSQPANDGQRSIVSLNLLSCPFIDNATKTVILSAYKIVDPADVSAVTKSRREWNVNWETFDLYAALQQKRLYEVY